MFFVFCNFFCATFVLLNLLKSPSVYRHSCSRAFECLLIFWPPRSPFISTAAYHTKLSLSSMRHTYARSVDTSALHMKLSNHLWPRFKTHSLSLFISFSSFISLCLFMHLSDCLNQSVFNLFHYYYKTIHSSYSSEYVNGILKYVVLPTSALACLCLTFMFYIHLCTSLSFFFYLSFSLFFSLSLSFSLFRSLSLNLFLSFFSNSSLYRRANS